MSEEYKNLTFEEAMENLEGALKVLSKGDLPLEKAVEQYKLGLDMATQCQAILRKAEGEIKILQNGIEEIFEEEERV